MVCLSRTEAAIKHRKMSGVINLIPKIESAKSRISDALSNSCKPVIAFSGGKDSLVVLDLVRSVDNTVIAVFENTTNEYPETLQFVKTITNIVELHPMFPRKCLFNSIDIRSHVYVPELHPMFPRKCLFNQDRKAPGNWIAAVASHVSSQVPLQPWIFINKCSHGKRLHPMFPRKCLFNFGLRKEDGKPESELHPMFPRKCLFNHYRDGCESFQLDVASHVSSQVPLQQSVFKPIYFR